MYLLYKAYFVLIASLLILTLGAEEKEALAKKEKEMAEDLERQANACKVKERKNTLSWLKYL